MTRLLTLETAVGPLTLVARGEALTHLCFATDAHPRDSEPGETPLLREAADQLRAYLAGRLRAFTVPLAPAGTPYMLRVWALLQAIPYGETASYQAVAARAGNKAAARAVGLANNRNPIPLFIPCHRVVGARGALTGYRGGLPLKARLLELERRSRAAPAAD